jgi:hypothetical protein
MSLLHSPKVVTNGLVFYYDIQNTKKSWLGAPTTNLKTNPDFSSGNSGYSAYVSSTPTVVNVTDFPESLGISKAVLQCTSASAPGGGGNSGGMFFANPTLTPGLAYTFSFWARIISHSSCSNTFSNQNGSGDNSNFAFSKTLTNTWTKYSYTTNSLDLMKGTWYVWTNLNSATWQYADFQIEQQSFATPFVNGTRSSVDTIKDLTGNKIVTVSSLTYNSDNTISFLNNTGFSFSSIDFSSGQTIEIWLRPDENDTNRRNPYNQAYGGYGTWTHEPGGSINYYYGDAGANATPYIGHDSSFTVLQNELACVCSTRDTTTSWWYKNGVQYNSYSHSYGTLTTDNNNIIIGSGYAGSYYGQIYAVKLYNRALTASEVSQNFNSLRGRYGI